MTAEEPARVSVVVPTRDRSALLAEALASINALRGPDIELEVIVVDNGAGHEAESVARASGARYLRLATQGAAAARNAGMRAATGTFISFLDDDDRWLSGHLRPHLSLLTAYPELAAVLGQVINCDSSLAGCSQPWPERLPGDGDIFAELLGICPQIGATVIRASVVQSVGFLDEELVGDEDWDWHLRLALRHKVGFVPVPSVLFRQRPPAVADDLEWTRLAFNRRVFWRNVRRAGRRRPPALRIARLYLKHNGAYAAGFLRSAATHRAAGEHRAARRALVRAAFSSPLHTVWGLLRAPDRNWRPAQTPQSPGAM